MEGQMEGQMKGQAETVQGRWANEGEAVTRILILRGFYKGLTAKVVGFDEDDVIVKLNSQEMGSEMLVYVEREACKVVEA